MTEYRVVTAEEFTPIAAVAEKYGVTEKENCLRFIDTQWDKTYDVWLLRGKRGRVILKKDKKRKGDKAVYDAYFAGRDFAVAKILDSVAIGDDLYVVMEYADGTDARDCSAEDAARIGRELARIQSAHLREGGHTEEAGCYFAKYVEDYCNKIRSWFPDFDGVLESVRERFFEAPQTLIHDDLLPINVLVNGEKVWIIDWETSGVLPYFLDLARFAFVQGEKEQFFITHASATAFLDAYYEEMRENGDFYEAKDQFLRDVAISAFCQYAMFLYYEEDTEHISETEDYKFLREIIAYLNRTK